MSKTSDAKFAAGLKTTVTLNDGNKIPVLGLGVGNMKTGLETVNSVECALHAGYRLFDTSSQYGNEADMGKAINHFMEKSGTPREDIFVTTKLWESDHGYEAALSAIKKSLRKLKLDYIDLYLIGSPKLGKTLRLESWRALIEARKIGLVRSIGVSNYGVAHIKELLAESNMPPVMNQIELHPYNKRTELVKFCQQHAIACGAFSPLLKGQKLNDEYLMQLAKRKGCTVSQLLIRWSLQRDPSVVCIPRSSKREHIVENADVFKFSLSDPEMQALDMLDCKYLSDPNWDPSTAP